jgi:hypothetical protein
MEPLARQALEVPVAAEQALRSLLPLVQVARLTPEVAAVGAEIMAHEVTVVLALLFCSMQIRCQT